MSSDEIPQADQAAGAPHPRDTAAVIGQAAAEAAFLEAHTAGRLHHAWLITGPKGVGKATLAWRIARFLLTRPVDGGLFGDAAPPTTLDADPNHPALPRIAALSEPNLFLLRRAWDPKKEVLKTVIDVETVRQLKSFFQMAAPDGGTRVVIVDAADEMNVNAANALLKFLEEPPADTVILIVAHQPSRLLPTILSRCRRLRCGVLTPPDLNRALAPVLDPDTTPDMTALSELAAGSVGAAVRLVNAEGLMLYSALVEIFANPKDRQRAIALGETAVGRANAARFDLILDLIDLFLTRLARAGTLGPLPPACPDEPAVFARMAPTPQAARRWATQQQELSARMRHGQAVNLDPAALILDTLLKIHQLAATEAAA